MTSHSFQIPRGAACVDGHFPGAPVVPGVVLLERVVAAVQGETGRRVAAIGRCKFIAALYPDQTCTIEWKAVTPDLLRFRCHGPQGLLVQGQLRLKAGTDG